MKRASSNEEIKSSAVKSTARGPINIQIRKQRAEEDLSALARFKLLKKTLPENPRPCSASQKLRQILAKTKGLKKENSFFGKDHPSALACLTAKSAHKGFQALSKAVSAHSMKGRQKLLKTNQDFALVAQTTQLQQRKSCKVLNVDSNKDLQSAAAFQQTDSVKM